MAPCPPQALAACGGGRGGFPVPRGVPVPPAQSSVMPLARSSSCTRARYVGSGYPNLGGRGAGQCVLPPQLGAAPPLRSFPHSPPNPPQGCPSHLRGGAPPPQTGARDSAPTQSPKTCPKDAPSTPPPRAIPGMMPSRGVPPPQTGAMDGALPIPPQTCPRVSPPPQMGARDGASPLNPKTSPKDAPSTPLGLPHIHPSGDTPPDLIPRDAPHPSHRPDRAPPPTAGAPPCSWSCGGCRSR